MNASLGYQLYRNIWIGLDWLFPPVCGGCGKTGNRWCAECQKKIQSISEPACNICGLPQLSPGLCKRCQVKRPSYKELRSWVVFEKLIQKALHRLKYRRDIGLGEALSYQMSEYVRRLAWPIDLIIPIPLGKKRLMERGYNQVAMIAMPLAMQLSVRYAPGALYRARETRSQVGLSVMERQENVKDAFKAAVRKVSGRTVLLVDDVSTTEATLSSAVEALYASGARDIYAVTVARALPQHGLRKV